MYHADKHEGVFFLYLGISDQSPSPYSKQRCITDIHNSAFKLCLFPEFLYMYDFE